MHIHVSKATFSTIDDKDFTGYEFVPSSITAAWEPAWHEYEIMAAKPKPEDTNVRYYLMPTKEYQNVEFELIFGFGYDCKGFTTSRVVAVRNAPGDENGTGVRGP